MLITTTSLALLLLAAQDSPTPTPAPAPVQAPCTAAEYRQFDFWIGDWNVIGPDGQLAGTNTITAEYGGCVLQEHWVAAGLPPQIGSSFNTWSAGRKQWHQTWVDSTGGFLLLDGEFRDGVMALLGEMPGRGGARVRHRLSWSRPAPVMVEVRLLWVSARPDGKTWTVVFDGRYVRKKSR
jgi:hypothetical protein